MAGNSTTQTKAPKEPRGELKKHTLTHQVRFDCERQILLDVGRGDPRWLSA